jgi:hypothetical protein
MQQVHTDGVTYRPISGPRPKARMSLIYRENAAASSPVAHMIRLSTQLVRADSARRASTEHLEPPPLNAAHSRLACPSGNSGV